MKSGLGSGLRLESHELRFFTHEQAVNFLGYVLPRSSPELLDDTMQSYLRRCGIHVYTRYRSSSSNNSRATCDTGRRRIKDEECATSTGGDSTRPFQSQQKIIRRFPNMHRTLGSSRLLLAPAEQATLSVTSPRTSQPIPPYASRGKVNEMKGRGMDAGESKVLFVLPPKDS